MSASRCRSCDAPIVWALTAEGRDMPVDMAPHPKGNLLLVRRRDGKLEVAVVGTHDGPRYRPHFATCPHAKLWRKR